MNGRSQRGRKRQQRRQVGERGISEVKARKRKGLRGLLAGGDIVSCSIKKKEQLHESS